MTDTNLITDDQLARLRAVAEDPFVAPSKRIEARTILKQIRRLKEGAESDRLRRELQRKIAAGHDLAWRERAIAQELGLIARRGDD